MRRTSRSGRSQRPARREQGAASVLRTGRVWALLFVGACASLGIPPGGPVDTKAPKLLQVVPESGVVNTTPRAVVFRFDEVVNERPLGAARLEDMFIVSPRGRGLDVEWNREEVWIRPQGGWRKNAVYTIIMLPGMSDLRGNVLKTGRTLVFASGAAIPDTRLSGILFDWVKGTPAPATLVEALDSRDTTLQYIALTDSSGRFLMRHVPPATYLVRGAVGAGSAIGASQGNALRPFDRRRAWDSVAVTVADSASVELLAFTHDTLGPRIGQLAVRDSVTLKLTLDQPLALDQVLARAQFTLLTRDSQPVFIDSVFTATAFTEWEKQAADSVAAARSRTDSLARRDSAARRDTAARAPGAPPAVPPAAPPRGARVTAPTAPRPAAAPTRSDSSADSTKRVPPPTPSKPIPVSEFVIRLGTPLEPQSQFRLKVSGARGLLGASRASERAFSTPKPASKDSTGAPKGAPAGGPARPGAGTPPGFTPAPPRDSTKPPPQPPSSAGRQ